MDILRLMSEAKALSDQYDNAMADVADAENRLYEARQLWTTKRAEMMDAIDKADPAVRIQCSDCREAQVDLGFYVGSGGVCGDCLAAAGVELTEIGGV